MTDGEAAAGTRRRRPRRDAEANRARLVRVALDLLAEHDDVPVRELAARAGVGAGTVYRHFPTHEDLVRACYDLAVDDLADRLAAAPAHATAWEGLVAFLEAWTLAIADTPGLRAAMRLMHAVDPSYAPARPYVATVAELLAAARDEGNLRPDVEPADVALVPLALGTFTGHPDASERDLLRRMLVLVTDGMRADGARSPLPATSVTAEQFHVFTHRAPVRRDRPDPA